MEEHTVSDETPCKVKQPRVSVQKKNINLMSPNILSQYASVTEESKMMFNDFRSLNDESSSLDQSHVRKPPVGRKIQRSASPVLDNAILLAQASQKGIATTTQSRVQSPSGLKLDNYFAQDKSFTVFSSQSKRKNAHNLKKQTQTGVKTPSHASQT